MAERSSGKAVGAGTVAGDGREQELDTDSRAAEAMEDERLESLLVTGATPTGVQIPEGKPGKAPRAPVGGDDPAQRPQRTRKREQME